MTIDYNSNHYVKVGNYTNVVMTLEKNRVAEPDPSKVFLCSFMEALIYKVALTHPEWTIVAVDPVWDGRTDRWRGTRFNIYKGEEYIGFIRRDGYFESEFKYEVHNDRISNARQRSGGMRSKDLKKALKAIEENFKPKSLEERRYKSVNEMSSHVQNTAWRTDRLANETIQAISQPVFAYLLQNMSTIRPQLEALGANPSALDAIPHNVDKIQGMRSVKAARLHKTGTTVALIEDRYMLIHDTDLNNHTLVTASQLDPEMSRKIGVLKVFENNDEAIEGIGIRLNAHTFYVVP